MDDKTAIEDRVVLHELKEWRRIAVDREVDFELAPDHGAPPGTTNNQLADAVFTRAIQAIETLAKVRELVGEWERFAAGIDGLDGSTDATIALVRRNCAAELRDALLVKP